MFRFGRIRSVGLEVLDRLLLSPVSCVEDVTDWTGEICFSATPHTETILALYTFLVITTGDLCFYTILLM